MGQLTRGTIVSEALLLAGDDSLTTRANVWLNAWLRSQYAAWPWPFLQKRESGIALAAGTTSLSFGAGAIVTPEVQRVLSPIHVYKSDYTRKFRADIRPLTSDPFSDHETVDDTSQGRGTPTEFKVRADATLWGKWSLVPWPVPDVALLLAIDYIVQPADISANATVPMYPNDRTMLQAVYVEALKYLQDARYGGELQVLASMVVDDRSKYGIVDGTNDILALDPQVFRRGGGR